LKTGDNSLNELIAPRVSNLADLIDQFILNKYGLTPPSNEGQQQSTQASNVSGLGPGLAATAATIAGGTIDTSSISSEVPPEGKAVLAAISSTESGGAYNIINYVAVSQGAPKYFSDYSHHPFEGQKGSTAAGRYQILASNWERYAPMAGVSDFSPASQDKVAWVFAQDVYRRQTNRDLAADVKNPEAHQYIISVLGGTWMGLADNPGKSLAALQSAAREGEQLI
jgi:muramidase (phage lysozyme)